MPRYRVFINGENFLLDMEGKGAKHGFYTCRIIDAPDPVSAENAAVEMIRETQRLRDVVLNEPGDPPTMNVTEIVEVDPSDDLEEPTPGFVFYAENPKRWWQFWKRGD